MENAHRQSATVSKSSKILVSLTKGESIAYITPTIRAIARKPICICFYIMAKISSGKSHHSCKLSNTLLSQQYA